MGRADASRIVEEAACRELPRRWLDHACLSHRFTEHSNYADHVKYYWEDWKKGADVDLGEGSESLKRDFTFRAIVWVAEDFGYWLVQVCVRDVSRRTIGLTRTNGPRQAQCWSQDLESPECGSLFLLGLRTPCALKILPISFTV